LVCCDLCDRKLCVPLGLIFPLRPFLPLGSPQGTLASCLILFRLDFFTSGPSWSAPAQLYVPEYPLLGPLRPRFFRPSTYPLAQVSFFFSRTWWGWSFRTQTSSLEVCRVKSPFQLIEAGSGTRLSLSFPPVRSSR